MVEHRSTSVAVVGLGLVGGSLARALLDRGVPVHGTDSSAAERAEAARAGVTTANDLPTLARATPDVVVLAVPPGAVRA
ncbi:MAG TPA: NAD(P)-binding domain-containing protein, partial [Gemmatimonadales bacterium]